jgi:hypothetical protein
MIPGTIAGNPNEQAVGFTGRANGTLLKSLILFIFASFLSHVFHVPLFVRNLDTGNIAKFVCNYLNFNDF